MLKSSIAVFIAGLLSDSGTNVGLPGGLYTSSPNSFSNFFFPSIVLMAVMPRSFDLRSEINAAIESMENPEERLLLKYRYLKNESWEDISYELNVSYRTVHRIHASALNNFIVPE